MNVCRNYYELMYHLGNLSVSLPDVISFPDQVNPGNFAVQETDSGHTVTLSFFDVPLKAEVMHLSNEELMRIKWLYQHNLSTLLPHAKNYRALSEEINQQEKKLSDWSRSYYAKQLASSIKAFEKDYKIASKNTRPISFSRARQASPFYAQWKTLIEQRNKIKHLAQPGLRTHSKFKDYLKEMTC